MSASFWDSLQQGVDRLEATGVEPATVEGMTPAAVFVSLMADPAVETTTIRIPTQVGWTTVRARAEEDLRAWLQDGDPA